MKRLPRKYKKQVKKIVGRKYASKMVMTALVTASARSQVAIIAATPLYTGTAVQAEIALKALRSVDIMVDTAQAIQKIMSEPPNSWRDFIR